MWRGISEPQLCYLEMSSSTTASDLPAFIASGFLSLSEVRFGLQPFGVAPEVHVPLTAVRVQCMKANPGLTLVS